MGTSSNSLIEGAVSLTSTKDLQEIFVKENITYPLNSQPKFNNIQRDTNLFGSIIITINIGKFSSWANNCLCRANSDLMDFWVYQATFDCPMK